MLKGVVLPEFFAAYYIFGTLSALLLLPTLCMRISALRTTPLTGLRDGKASLLESETSGEKTDQKRGRKAERFNHYFSNFESI